MKALLTSLILVFFITSNAKTNTCFRPFDKTEPSCEMQAGYIKTIDRLWFSLNQCSNETQERFFASSFELSITTDIKYSNPYDVHYSRFENGIFDKNSRDFLFENLQPGDKIVFSNVRAIVKGREKLMSDLTIIVEGNTSKNNDPSITQNEPSVDECHSVLDIQTNTNERVSNAILSLDKVLGLRTLLFSYNMCEYKAEETETLISSARIIAVPEGRPASMMTSSAKLTQGYYGFIRHANLESGDRVLFEGLKYEKDGITYSLKPLVITIE